MKYFYFKLLWLNYFSICVGYPIENYFAQYNEPNSRVHTVIPCIAWSHMNEYDNEGWTFRYVLFLMSLSKVSIKISDSIYSQVVFTNMFSIFLIHHDTFS